MLGLRKYSILRVRGSEKEVTSTCLIEWKNETARNSLCTDGLKNWMHPLCFPPNVCLFSRNNTVGTIRFHVLCVVYFFFNKTTACVGTRLTKCGARGSTMVDTFRTTLGALWPSRNSVGRRLRPTKMLVSRRTSPIIVDDR